jgi:hypothetical protein
MNGIHISRFVELYIISPRASSVFADLSDSGLSLPRRLRASAALARSIPITFNIYRRIWIANFPQVV